MLQLLRRRLQRLMLRGHRVYQALAQPLGLPRHERERHQQTHGGEQPGGEGLRCSREETRAGEQRHAHGPGPLPPQAHEDNE